MNDVTKDLIAAIEAAFREGFRSPTTYNDTVLNSEDEEWEKSDAKAAIARAEAALAEPQPDADGWIPWAGGECPEAEEVLVEVRLRSGAECINQEAKMGADWLWDHDGGPGDIIAYRVVKSFRELVNDLLAYHADIAVDPRVSGAAAKLVEQARAEEREACLRCYSPDDTATDWADRIKARGQK